MDQACLRSWRGRSVSRGARLEAWAWGDRSGNTGRSFLLPVAPIVPVVLLHTVQIKSKTPPQQRPPTQTRTVSKEVFLISDMHFGHSAMYERPFRLPDGSRLRPFSSAEEADEIMVERWNKTVRSQDKVYVLGDIAIPQSGLQTLSGLNGDKVLIAGNHDWPFERKLGTYFRSVRAYWKLDSYTLSHVPIHPSSLRGFDCNIHGHLHAGRVLTDDLSIDPRYFCVCVEHTDYAPMHWEQVKHKIKKQQNA